MSSGDRGGLVEAWYAGAWWLWLLRPLEFLFRCIVAVRRAAYRSGLLARYRAPRPLVVVGNITVGGTGKTPIVIALVEHLQRGGVRPGVVARGYGATAGVFPHRVGEASGADDCGDEPLLIHRRTGCPCVVDPDRGRAVQSLLAEGDVDLVISDDGLQHYALERDLEIAVLDARAMAGNGFCLPAGPLREPASRLNTVDFVLLRGSGDKRQGVTYAARALVNLHSGEERAFSPDGIGAQVTAIAGIGQPRQFFDSLRAAGFEPETRVFPDHHHYGEADLREFPDRPLIMTEKDAVKCRAIAGANAWFLRIDAILPDPLLEAVTALAKSPSRE